MINVSVLPPHGPLYKHDIAMNLQEEGMMEDRETEKVKRREGQYVYYFKSLALLSKCSCNHKNVVKLFFFKPSWILMPLITLILFYCVSFYIFMTETGHQAAAGRQMRRTDDIPADQAGVRRIRPSPQRLHQTQ